MTPLFEEGVSPQSMTVTEGVWNTWKHLGYYIYILIVDDQMAQASV